ncbi:hypothetical protein AGMMS49525_18340 [Bacteroidia bacterium]|nr:hypothetical protein AGMMS49525_18340 [Bacteroidia bacterium]
MPPAASASEGTMYYRISDGKVYILLVDGGKHWEPVGSGPIPSDIAAKAKKLAFGVDSAKLAGIASGANFVLVENILTLTATMNALSANMGRALYGSIQKDSTILIAVRDSVYTKAQTLAGNKTFSGTNTFTVSPTVPSKSTAAGANSTVVATEAQVNLKANLASPTFTGTVSVPTKTTAATNSGRRRPDFPHNHGC